MSDEPYEPDDETFVVLGEDMQVVGEISRMELAEKMRRYVSGFADGMHNEVFPVQLYKGKPAQYMLKSKYIILL